MRDSKRATDKGVSAIIKPLSLKDKDGRSIERQQELRHVYGVVEDMFAAALTAANQAQTLTPNEENALKDAIEAGKTNEDIIADVVDAGSLTKEKLWQ